MAIYYAMVSPITCQFIIPTECSTKVDALNAARARSPRCLTIWSVYY